MFKLLFSFLLLEFVIARKFRLMEPQTDEKAPGHKNFVKIIVDNSDDDDIIESFSKYLFTYNQPEVTMEMTGGKNKYWHAIHIARDVVTISPKLNIKKCLTYGKKKNKFSMEMCKTSSLYEGQKFLITNKIGIWKGTTINGYYYGDKNNDVIWGMCPDCIPGGFGSEEQGDVQDIIMKIFEENPKLYRDYYS